MVKFPVRKCYHAAKICVLLVLVVFIIALFEKWKGGKKNAYAEYTDPLEATYEREILEDEARIIPGLGEGGVAAHLMGEDKILGEESEKKLAINVYLSDRIAYNRTLIDFRNPACKRVVYDAELPSASVVLIFHNEPYSVVVRTIWSVVNSARRNQPWYKQANFVDRESGRIMTLGYPGQDPSSPFVYLKEIILVDDNSTLPELKGKLSHYVRTRLPPDLIRILRLPDRVGLTQARMAGSRAATADVLVFLDAHCEGNKDWLRPLLQRIKEKRDAVLTPVIDMLESNNMEYNPGHVVNFEIFSSVGLTRARLAGARYAVGDVLVFLDSHCEGQADWLRPVLQRVKDSPHAVVVPIIDVIDASTFYYSVQDPVTFQVLRCSSVLRQGLILARIRGARTARGDVLIFLDAHCEVGTDWLRPLLQRIRHKRDAVLTPLIDVVDQTSFQLDAAEYFQVGGFTFMGHFNWIEVPEREKKRRGSDIAPTWSPTMAGGLFAINRAYYWELGAYDEQMAGWGGENLEMSFRIWQCGGTLETIPCSRVGHVFRSFHPYGLPAQTDTHGINTARMAEVWMDEYAELFYLHRPDLRNNPKVGDVTHRKILREKLKCKSFQWYLDNIYKEKFVPVRDVYGYGRFMNLESNLCLDTLQREGASSPLGVYPCHERLQATQYFSLSLAGELRDEENCAEVQHTRGSVPESARRVLMMTCAGKQRQKWRYLPSGQLQHIASALCLDAGYEQGADATAVQCQSNSGTQKWRIDYTQDNDFRVRGVDVLAQEQPPTNTGYLNLRGRIGHFGGEGGPTEQEQRLSKLRGQRRISRSLLSYENANENETNANTTIRRHKHKKAHKKKHARKRSRKQRMKNKFILKIIRTLMNNTEEHLEVDIHCKHRQLYPNNSFVRDLVTILNEKNIKVINNGRIFERNKVTELVKGTTSKVLQKMDIPESENIRSQPEKVKPWHNVKHRHEKILEPLAALEPEKKIIIEDFIEVTTTTLEPVHQIKRRKRKRLRVSPSPAILRSSPLAVQHAAFTQDTSTLSDALVNDVIEDSGGVPMAEEVANKEDRSQKLFEEEGMKERSLEDSPTNTREELINTLDRDNDRASESERWHVGESRYRSDVRKSHARGHSNKHQQNEESRVGRAEQIDRESEANDEHRPAKYEVKSVMDESPPEKHRIHAERRRERLQSDQGTHDPAPVKLVMRSNLTLNLGDEFFKWRNPKNVADLLGELSIPGDTGSPDDIDALARNGAETISPTPEASAEDNESSTSDSSGE